MRVRATRSPAEILGPRCSARTLCIAFSLLAGVFVRAGSAQPIEPLTQDRGLTCNAVSSFGHCYDGASKRDVAPDFGDYDADIGAAANRCYNQSVSVGAEQVSTIRPDFIDIYTRVTSVAQGGGGNAYSYATITFRIGPFGDYEYDLLADGTTGGYAGLGALEVSLRHPDGRVDSLQIRSESTWSSTCCQATRQIHRKGLLEAGEYSLALEARAQQGLFYAWATSKVHFAVRRVVPVAHEAITWTHVKVLFR